MTNVEKTEHFDRERDGKWFSLSPRERAGGRGKAAGANPQTSSYSRSSQASGASPARLEDLFGTFSCDYFFSCGCIGLVMPSAQCRPRLILKMGSNRAITMNPTTAPTTRIKAGASNEINTLVRARICRSSMSATLRSAASPILSPC